MKHAAGLRRRIRFMKRCRWARGLLLTLVLCALCASAGAENYTKLRYRDSGDAVLRLQQALNQLGYAAGTADGKFGAATEKAVRNFQKANGLTQDGIAGNATQTLLYQMANGTVAAVTPAPSTSGTTNVSGGTTTGLFAGNYQTLQYGSRGTRVTTLQNALNQLGFSAGTADGRFGLGTQKAVVSFQKSAGLKQDGKAGKATLVALEKAVSGETTVTPAPGSSATAAPSSGIPTRILRQGASGDDVKSVQTRLQALGYYAGTIDGKYGSGTIAAMQAFQSRNGLTVDGKAGSATYAVLYSANAVPAYATAAPDGVATATPTPAPATPTPSSGWTVPTRILRKGAQGSDVKSVQTRLQSLGYYAGTIDGKYGSGTISAMQEFQRRNGLVVDGKAGSNTYAKLFSDSAVGAETTTPTPMPTGSTIPTRTLQSGSSGEDVKLVQNRLKALGYYSGTVDGSFGSGTVTALKAFQLTNNLTSDGIAGSGTYAKLFSDSAIAAGASATNYPTLRVGATGSDVTQLQTALSNLKYTVTVNGTYDAATKEAVIAFQQRNMLGVDGVAGPSTLAKLYSGSAVTGDTAVTTPAPNGGGDVPSVSELKLLHWYTDVKPVLRGKKSIYVYDPASGYSFTLHLYSLGRHADVEPMTAQDTANMMAAFGGKAYWEPVKFVYVKLPNGVWTVATMHNVAHGGQSIKDNNFNGQNCVHFLRDMDECTKNDPSYGVKNQKAIRENWKRLTGETVD